MQGVAITQKQQLRTIPVQIQASAILNMNLLDLQQFIEAETMENPALSIEETSRCPVCSFRTRDNVCPVCGASMSRSESLSTEKFDEHDYLERAFAIVDDGSEFDPFRTVASTQCLGDYLKQQARMSLSGRKLRIAEFLIESLDEDGYFRESLFETAEEFAAAVPEIESVLAIIQSFDPAGIAACDLRECLLIQVRSISDKSPVAANAEHILMDYWDNFSRMKLKAIAQQMEVPVSAVQEACEYIREFCNPRPASGYHAPFDELAPKETAAIVPDIIVQKKGDALVAKVVDCYGSSIKVDETYDEIYESLQSGSCMSEDDCKHIREHVERVRTILEAISLRKKTLARVANYLLDYQKGFLTNGASHLKPLRQKDVAQALEVHESTICRALAGKSCRLPSGEVVSFEVFFDSALPIRYMISQLIARSTEPLSDNDITKKLAENGVTIARRTVAKYRDQLKVLPYQLRAA